MEHYFKAEVLDANSDAGVGDADACVYVDFAIPRNMEKILEDEYGLSRGTQKERARISLADKPKENNPKVTKLDHAKRVLAQAGVDTDKPPTKANLAVLINREVNIMASKDDSGQSWFNIVSDRRALEDMEEVTSW